MLNEQLQLVLLDEERAVAALPKLLQTDESETAAALGALRQLVGAAGALDAGGRAPAGAGRETVWREADEIEERQWLTRRETP